MHDPFEATKDEENQTTALANHIDTKEGVSDEENSEDEDEMDVATFRTEQTTGASVTDVKTDTKPQAMYVDDKDEEDVNDAPMEDESEEYDQDDNTNDDYENTNDKTDKNENKTETSKSDSTNDTESEKRKNDTTTDTKPANGQASSSAPTANGGSSIAPGGAAPPPPPVLKGTLSFNVETRRHMIRGMWNYENSSTFPPQRFELLRNLDRDEDATVLPSNGEFHGSFSLAYFHTTSKGKQKERSKVIPESGVKIKFIPIEGKEGEFDVDGEGTNQFGVFNVNGTATPSEHEGDPTYDIVLRKRYKPSKLPAAGAAGDKKKKKRKSTDIGVGVAADVEAAPEVDEGPLPPPSESFPSRVVCLRGKLQREQSEDFGGNEGVYRINGMWSSGLDLILADPQNVRGLCNRFEYEHKSSSPNNSFPVSGRYSGWFDLTSEDGTRTRINEKDITLKFRKNNAGYHNVEGKGSNAFGKYNISGTLTVDSIITIFRHFQAPKKKAKDPAVKVSGAAAVAAPPVAPGRTKYVAPPPEMKLRLDDVEIPGGDKDDVIFESIPPPLHGTYSAVSRGIMRLNDDGAHTCSGKWAMTREHFNNGTVSNFAFRLEPHFAAQGAAAMKKANGEEPEEDTSASTGVSLSAAPPGSLTFPVDSALYKGSFQMKRGATKYTSVIDQQIVLKFRKNKEGSFNVHGKGINSIGIFTLIGKLILSGKSSGHVELYRMYPLPAAPPAQPGVAAAPAKVAAVAPFVPKAQPAKPIVDKPPQVFTAAIPARPLPAQLLRRESSRLVKLPSRLEDDDPNAQINRLLEKCSQVLKFMRDKDIASGAFFGGPVDPVALGLPTYHQIIKEPMDLGTIQGMMDAEDVETPEEFGRLVRLIFENAMTFNVETTHVVHQSGRQLLILFNQKFRDIERMSENIRRQHKLPDAVVTSGLSTGKQFAKGKKRKGGPDEMKSLKMSRLEEAQAMAAGNSNAMNALISAAPPGSTTGGSVSRTEFNLMIQMIQKLQGQVVQTYSILADMSPETLDEPSASAMSTSAPADIPPYVPYVPPQEAYLPPIQERKKPAPKRKEPAPMDEEKPLTFDEQQELTETINTLPAEKLPGVIKIIRESANFGDDEEEIDLEIDQLDTITQRKLQRFVMKNVKPPRKKAKAAPKKKLPAKKAETSSKPMPAVPKKPQPTPGSKPAEHGSFFAFGSKGDDSDSDSDDGEILPTEATASEPAKNDDFHLGDAQDDDDDNDDLGNGGFGGNWSMAATSKPAAASASKDADDDDWGAAREQAEVAKARDAERKAREEKMRAEAEQANNQRRADEALRGEEARAQREEEAVNEAKLHEQKKKEALEKKQAARDAERVKLQAVEQTVDLDEQRDIMKQFENNYMGDEADGASPSSDFGF